MAKEKLSKVISISRRMDMAACVPDQVVHLLSTQFSCENVHTLVFWTKNPNNLVRNDNLYNEIKKYDQIFIHLTVTGMGGTMLEPGVPEARYVLGLLPDLINLTGSPHRIRLRFDPIVHLKLQNGSAYSNFSQFESIAATAKNSGITQIITSWMSEYPKVTKRLQKSGIFSLPVSNDLKRVEYEELLDICMRIGMHLSVCCDPQFNVSCCIDGSLLNRMHPSGKNCSTEKAGAQREKCGCTKSRDIGWYYPCQGGCLYCYANPRVQLK